MEIELEDRLRVKGINARKLFARRDEELSTLRGPDSIYQMSKYGGEDFAAHGVYAEGVKYLKPRDLPDLKEDLETERKFINWFRELSVEEKREWTLRELSLGHPIEFDILEKLSPQEREQVIQDMIREKEAPTKMPSPDSTGEYFKRDFVSPLERVKKIIDSRLKKKD